MRPLQRADLLSLEAYAVERPAFRARVLAHKRARRLALGAHASLLFEDRLTAHYQVQEMLRIERIFEPDRVQDELDAYNPLIPDGSDLRATLMLEYADRAQRRDALPRLAGIERAVFAEVAGAGRCRAQRIDDTDAASASADKAAALCLLRFAFPEPAIAALRGGAALAFGIDDPRMPLRVETTADQRASLLRDLQ